MVNEFFKFWSDLGWLANLMGISLFIISFYSILPKVTNWINKKLLGIKTNKIEPYYNIKIGDGCLSLCTYCATRFATKKVRSRKFDDIIADFKHGLEKGYKIIQFIKVLFLR